MFFNPIFHKSMSSGNDIVASRNDDTCARIFAYMDKYRPVWIGFHRVSRTINACRHRTHSQQDL